jgi:hypothetical protein
LDYLANPPHIIKSTELLLELQARVTIMPPTKKTPVRSSRRKEYESRIKWTTGRLNIHLYWLIENKDQVGKRSRADIAYFAYEETALKHDMEVTLTRVGNKIDALRVSYREALGLRNQTGNGTTLDGITLRDKQSKKCPTFDRCDEVWGGKTNIAPLAPKDT